MFGESVGSLSQQLKKAKKKKAESTTIRAEYINDAKSPSEYRPETTSVRPERQEEVSKRRIATPKPTQHVYPERVFDQLYERKTTWLRGEDVDVMKAVASEIMSGRKRLVGEVRNSNRVTDNNIIRLLIQSFCEKIEGEIHHTDFSKIQTEEEIKNYIENVMRF